MRFDFALFLCDINGKINLISNICMCVNYSFLFLMKKNFIGLNFKINQML
jgi:hypothetical protein